MGGLIRVVALSGILLFTVAGVVSFVGGLLTAISLRPTRTMRPIAAGMYMTMLRIKIILFLTLTPLLDRLAGPHGVTPLLSVPSLVNIRFAVVVLMMALSVGMRFYREANTVANAKESSSNSSTDDGDSNNRAKSEKLHRR